MNTTPALYDPNDLLYDTRSPILEAFHPELTPRDEPYPAPSPSPVLEKARLYAPDTEVLIRALGPNNPELHRIPLPEKHLDSTAMTDPSEGTDPIQLVKLALTDTEYTGQSGSDLDARDLAAKATAAVNAQEAVSTSERDTLRHDLEARHDSAQERVPQLSNDQRQQLSGRHSPSLRLQTSRDHFPSETITTSPTLSKHIITTAEANFGTLPAYHASFPTKDGTTTSPQSEKLPGLQQVIHGQLRPGRPLEELAEVATAQDPRVPMRQHSQSFGSTTAPSPMMSYHYGSAAYTAASPYYPRGSARSPTSTISDQMYMSPTQWPGAAYYNDRRSEPSGEMHPPMMPPSLPSASSGESHATTSSSIDDYSTAQTTPGEGPESMRPILPPPPGMAQSAFMVGQGFTCDYPGCTAAPFQTQYLLSSHRNVHSQVRNHYCPVKECPRSEGGKGFKRKNEMIRHGLVHESPGYVCPFCPDKEHKYPRPDNLQRHVRVHHTDKDKDDAQLREVLAQRREGVGKTRRRRANTAGSAS
ncbi:uncharacterized protein LTR77_003421 [Saxophila tyrrhenica]|uniref:C2H2-type domain-containing protein n=1 Tax=Saxophila tyrrhenica TaxID=1690608 RepID=A0AAV9PDX5_9PEZI|nr:hypothetical protein LTR77_003421 [Saxophila tyrrhenica]